MAAAVLAAAAATVGLSQRSSGAGDPFVTARGETVTLAGSGLYRFDTVFAAMGNTATHAVVLAFAVPLTVIAVLRSRVGSPSRDLLLVGALGYLLYVGANYALGVAYNPMFLCYVGWLSASLFGFVTAVARADRSGLQVAIDEDRVPRRSLAIFLLASAAVTTVVWGAPLVAALRVGRTPDLLAGYTTPVTYALDLAVITPSAALAGILVLRGRPLGYLIAVPLLVTIVLLLPTIALSTILQTVAGVRFTPGQVVGPIAGFALLGIVGSVLTAQTLRGSGGR